MKVRFKHRVEYALFLGFARLLRVLPHRAALCAGCGLAAIVHFIFGFRRKEALKRLEEVFGHRYSHKEMKRIAWVSFRNIVFNGVEALRLDRYKKAWFETCFNHREVLEEVTARTAQGQGVIVVLTHTGNWDLSSRVAELNGIPAVYIARSQSNPLTYGYFHRVRTKAGILIEDRDDPSIIRKVIRHLNEGRMLGVMVDLRARTPSPGLKFLGQEAHIAGGLGLIARKSNAIVLPISIARKGWFKHQWTLNEPIQSDSALPGKVDRQRIMQHCLDQLSPMILTDPEQYFWYNKRWVLQPFPSEPETEALDKN
jgi:Kdo2-lipid IVA lauroyltransferase/acyltransferase